MSVSYLKVICGRIKSNFQNFPKYSFSSCTVTVLTFYNINAMALIILSVAVFLKFIWENVGGILNFPPLFYYRLKRLAKCFADMFAYFLTISALLQPPCVINSIVLQPCSARYVAPQWRKSWK